MPVSPEMAEGLTKQVRDLYEAAEYALLARLATALEEGIGSPRWAELKLRAIGDLRGAVEEVSTALQQDSDGAVRQALMTAYGRGRQAAVAELGSLDIGRELAAREALPNAAAVDWLAMSLARDTRPLYQRITRAVTDAFRSIVARVTGGVLLGVESRRQATQRALNVFANRGITGFIDKAGRSWDMASYAEMAVRSVTARAAIEGHTDVLAELGVGLVIVSDAPLECPLCERWEGEVLALNGAPGPRVVRAEHTTEDNRIVTVHVVGTLLEARAAGLFHPNCRHSLSAYLPGITTRPQAPPTPGTTYADTQRQREIERHIRRWKRRQAAAMTEKERRAAGAKIRAWQAVMRDHIAAHDALRRKPERERLATGNPDGTLLPEGKQKVDERAPKRPVKPEVEAPATRTTPLSEASERRIAEVRGQLPRERDGWLDARRQLVDHSAARSRREAAIARATSDLENAHAERDEVVRRKEEEFRRRRTPKVKRPDLLREATAPIDNWIEYLEGRLQEDRQRLQELARRPPEYQFTYRRDPNGRLLPPEEYEKYLDQVLGVGELLRGDLGAALDGDEEHQRMFERVQELVKEPNVDPAQLRAAQSRLASRQAEAIRRLLADARGMGGSIKAEAGDAEAVASRGEGASEVRPDWRDLLQESLQHFPAEWLERMKDHLMVLVGSDRAYYLGGGGPGGADLFALGTREPAYNGAFSSQAAEVAMHELGHRMEQYVPGLRELEYTLVRRRAVQDGVLDAPEELSAIYPGSAYGQGEQTYRDEWADAYAGKTYEAYARSDPASMPSEAFQVGLQDLFGRSGRRFGGLELQYFVLGCLAVL